METGMKWKLKVNKNEHKKFRTKKWKVDSERILKAVDSQVKKGRNRYKNKEKNLKENAILAREKFVEWKIY